MKGHNLLIFKLEFAGIWKRFCIGGVLQMEIIGSLVIAAAMQANGIKAITKLTPGVTDDMLVALNSKDIITEFRTVVSTYTGKNT